MTDKPVSLASPPEGYADWMADIKARVPAARQRAALAANAELVTDYISQSIDPPSYLGSSLLPNYRGSIL
jgi:hypothetical protein